MRTRLPLPRGWKRRVKSSIVHVLALSHYTPNLFESTTNMPFLAHQESLDHFSWTRGSAPAATAGSSSTRSPPSLAPPTWPRSGAF